MANDNRHYQPQQHGSKIRLSLRQSKLSKEVKKIWLELAKNDIKKKYTVEVQNRFEAYQDDSISNINTNRLCNNVIKSTNK